MKLNGEDAGNNYSRRIAAGLELADLLLIDKFVQKMAEISVPNEINCSEQVFSIDFHPIGSFIASGLINGSVEIWQYGEGEHSNRKVLDFRAHNTSCRGIKFSHGGDTLYSISSDRSLRGTNGDGGELFVLANAHSAAINRLELISENALVTGDDSGVVKLWDVRTLGYDATPVLEWHLHEDFVSDFAFNNDSSTLVSTSGDCTFCLYDVRNPANHFRSEQLENDLHCVEVLGAGGSALFGGEEGLLAAYTWDQWDGPSSSIPGHSEAVDCMWKIDESTVITGSSDGLLRVVSLLPNKILGVIGDHEEFPVEGLSASRDARLLASFAHDEIVRFWDLGNLSQLEDTQQGGYEADQNTHFAAGMI